jgi:hypothetical protein
MEYLLIIILQLLGIYFHVMQKISIIDKKYPEKPLPEIRAIFWREDSNTLGISAGVLVLHVITHFIIDYYDLPIRDKSYFGVPYLAWAFGLALLGGYAGQRLIYKAFGSAEKVINTKLEKVEANGN